MVSDYERGRRTYSDAMAKRLSKTLKVKEDRLRYGSKPVAAHSTRNSAPKSAISCERACRAPGMAHDFWGASPLYTKGKAMCKDMHATPDLRVFNARALRA